MWMPLELDQFLESIFCFYKEKERILEERHLRVENLPIGLMLEKFIDTAHKVHPYKLR